MAGTLLELNNIHVYYGLAHILQGVSLSLQEGEAVALLGRNGAGKSTTLKSIMSLVSPKKGKIRYEGADITSMAPHLVARKGISMVPEGKHIFPALNVIEHLRVPVTPAGVNRDHLFEKIFHIFPELEEKKGEAAISLSGGQQQMLVIARSLMTIPRLLLLDEPMEGLAPTMVKRVMAALQAIQKEGVTMFFASTNCERALPVASRVYMIEKGKIVYRGTREELMRASEIQRSYLGVRD